jgi:hypothetical protein
MIGAAAVCRGLAGVDGLVVLEVGMRCGKPGSRTEPAAVRVGHFG